MHAEGNDHRLRWSSPVTLVINFERTDPNQLWTNPDLTFSGSGSSELSARVYRASSIP